MKLTVKMDPEQLRSIEGEWRELLSRSGQDEPTLLPEWVLAWWDVFGGTGGRELRVVELREDERLVGLAPLVSRTRRHRGALVLRRLELACSGEPEEDEVQSEYIGVVAEHGSEHAVAGALVDAIVSRQFGAVDEFGIPAMSSADPMCEALLAAFRARRWRAELRPFSEAPYAPLPATWNEYLAGLPSRRRHTIRRSERDLQSWAVTPPTVRVADDARSLEAGQQALERLHGERWEAAGRRGAFASPAFNRFHAQVMPALLQRGALELLWLESGSAPIAVLYNIVWNGKVYNYQSGRRMDLPESIRPGLAVHAVAIRRAIELGRREYDFLAGPRRYKREFSVALRPLLTLEAARPGPRDSARRLLDRMAAAARRLRAASPAPVENAAAIAVGN